MKPYQKFMGGKTKFLYLRICCYFHLVPVCANFRFWFLCVCVCAAGFVYFCEGWRHILCFFYLFICFDNPCSLFWLISGHVNDRRSHSFPSSFQCKFGFENYKLHICFHVSIESFRFKPAKTEHIYFFGNNICLLKTAMGGHEGFAWLSESHKGRGVRGIDWDTLCAISG